MSLYRAFGGADHFAFTVVKIFNKKPLDVLFVVYFTGKFNSGTQSAVRLKLAGNLLCI